MRGLPAATATPPFETLTLYLRGPSDLSRETDTWPPPRTETRALTPIDSDRYSSKSRAASSRTASPHSGIETTTPSEKANSSAAGFAPGSIMLRSWTHSSRSRNAYGLSANDDKATNASNGNIFFILPV